MKAPHRLLLILLAIVLLTGFIGYGLYSSKYHLSISPYTIETDKLDASIRIVQLTDLHNSVFGQNNSRLIARVAEQEPDLILITGDLLNENEQRTDIAVGLIEGLTEIAPVYVSYGNHEKGYEERYGAELRKLYTEAGATVLEYDWVDLTVKGQSIRLGGLYGYCLPAKYLETGEARERECNFLKAFQDTDATTILMCHMPVCWIMNGSLDEWNVDIVFAGHAHGGQVRIPFVGGLWAPDQEWFPGRESGLYFSEAGKKVLVLSRGLGNTEKIPRFNNVPEVLVALCQ